MTARTSTRPAIICIVVLLLLAVPLGMRDIALLPLYTNAALRSQVMIGIDAIADRKGWLTSDIALLSVSDTTLRFRHQPHGQIRRPAECYDFSFATSALMPCAD